MPTPTAHHRRLEALVGNWQGQETLHPSPWAAETRHAIGRFHCRFGLDGMFLISDYEEERDGEVLFRGHGVYGYDARRERYTMYWFDSFGMNPNEVLGVWRDDELVFTGKGEHGRSRYIYTVRDADTMRFRIETGRDGADANSDSDNADDNDSDAWQIIMEGEYSRA